MDVFALTLDFVQFIKTGGEPEWRIVLTAPISSGKIIKEFMNDVEKLALIAYAIPAFMWPELYKMIDAEKDIAMRVVWMPETTVKQIKDFDKRWFLEKY